MLKIKVIKVRPGKSKKWSLSLVLSLIILVWKDYTLLYAKESDKLMTIFTFKNYTILYSLAVTKKTWWTIKYSELLRIDYASGKNNSLISKRAFTSHRRNFRVDKKDWLEITKCTRSPLSLLIFKASFRFHSLHY